jgi:hypothetical protein
MIPRISSLIVPCASGIFLGGSQGGAGMPPPGYVQRSRQCPNFFFFGAVFAIFSGFVN